MAHKKLDRKDIILLNKNLEQLRKYYDELKNFSKIIHEEDLGISTRHGNFGGKSRLISMGVKFSIDEKDLKSPYNFKIISLSPKIFIKYSCTEGMGDLLFESGQIKLFNKKKMLHIDFILSCNPGYPGYIGIEDRESFLQVKKTFKKCCQIAGFKQKDMIMF